MPTPDLRAGVAAARRFTRFYTQRIGVLRPSLLDSGLPLAAARVVYELAQQEEITASALAQRLAMDAGQLSRLLAALRRRGLARERRGPGDRRERRLRLTAAGRQCFRRLDRASERQMASFLRPLSPEQRRNLAHALATAQELLGGGAAAPGPHAQVHLRHPRPGDLGWVVHRQGALYAREYGWDATFEGLVAEIVAGFLRRHDPRRERCWIADRGGQILGSIFLVRQSDKVAKLRLLYVEPEARGAGLGRKLVAACIAFARKAGYSRITLWTNDVLVSARRIYQAAGFELVREERHHSFGKDLVGQNWDLALR